MKEPHPDHTLENPRDPEMPAASPDARTNPAAGLPGRPRLKNPDCGAHRSMQPWPVLVTGKAEPVERLFLLLEITRTRNINSLVIQAVLALHFREDANTVVHLSDLAGAVGTTNANVTSVADNMERLGLASRMESRLDRRRISIALTPHGKSFVNWIHQMLAGAPGGECADLRVPSPEISLT